jgi:multidrug resistance protein, MATE family
MSHHARSIIRLGAPLLAGNLSMYLYRLADSIMVGRLGVEALAGIAYGTIYATVHEMLVWPVALGVQAVVTRRMGRRMGRAGDEGDGAGPVADRPGDEGDGADPVADRPADTAIDTGAMLPQGLYAGFFAGSTALLLASLAPLFLPLLTTGTATATALSYVRISMWALPLMGLASGSRGFLAGIGFTRVVMVAIVLSNMVNVFFNWVFIFGMLGAPALGVRGAAAGTVIAHGVSLAVLVGYAVFSRSVRAEHYSAASRRPRGVTILRVVSIGLPSAIQNASAMLVMLLFQGIVGTLGAMQVAVTHVLFSTFRIKKTLVGGFANGASILVGNYLGAERPADARRVINAQMKLGAVIGGGLLVVVVSFAPALGRLFALDGAALDLATFGLRVLAPFYFIEIIGYSLEIIFSHNGWGRYVLVSEFITNMAGILGVSALLVLWSGAGVGGAWTGYAAYQVGHALILLGGLRSGGWQRTDVDPL